jgi:ABC-type nitrate/sulfonate/bicarbonate transport system substrate-binding protein
MFERTAQQIREGRATMSKTLASALTGAALAVTLVASASAAELETTELSFGFGIDLPFAPHIVAIEKGWFEEAGFTSVTTQTFTAGALAGEALVAGEIQLWTPGNLPPISMVHNGVPVVILGTNCINHGLEKVVVRNDAGVDTPEDLYDVKLGLLLGSTSGAMLGNIAAAYDLDWERVSANAVNLAPPEALASMAAGDTQGMVVWEPWIYRALNEIDSKVVHTGLVSGFEGNMGETVQVSNNRSMWVASQEWVRDNPIATQALMEVLVRAQKYVADPANRAEVVALFSAFQNQEPAMNEALFDNYVFDATFDDAYVADMAAIADFLQATGRIKDRMDVLDYTYTAPLAAIDPALVKMEGRWQP